MVALFPNSFDSMKTLMALTQLKLNNLSVPKDVGKAFGLLAGIASDHFPTLLLLFIGSLDGVVVSHRICPLPYWQIATSCAWAATARTRRCWSSASAISLRTVAPSPPSSRTTSGAALPSSPTSAPPSSCLLPPHPRRRLHQLLPFFCESPLAADADDSQNEESRYFAPFNAIVAAVYLLLFDVSDDHGLVLPSPLAIALRRSRSAPTSSSGRTGGPDSQAASLAKGGVAGHVGGERRY